MYTQDNVLSKNKLLNSFQLSKMHTFEVAARHCSFSLAAEELSMTPSAISHRINALESELGILLFKRSHRKIALTSDGERIYIAVKSSLSSLNQEIFEVKSNEISGELTVYSRPSFAQCWLVPRIASFQKQYPAISLNILTGNENINFHGHGIDVAIYFDEKQPSKLYCQDIMAETIVPVCSPEYAEKLDLIGNIDNLSQCTLLHDNQAWGYDSNTDEWGLWANNFSIHWLSSIASIRFDRSDLAVIAAMNNAGVAMGRESLISSQIKRGELIKPFIDKKMRCPQRYYVATLANKSNTKIEIFIDWLKSEVQNEEFARINTC
ncbi:colanic acid biosynthesis glycosyltransferase WcaA [Colwellia psychrerythraea]|uniref:Colanic acid biosynthesis glycosyltransferase WcaA n=1 Tax=Colwellia psychrerythraea TaxID=28229 RepID=A0A1Y5E3V3_COLPS|nr:colanic acid biosynthesis glycosyltransferase WcaA [Colwellia psychrerythraea]